MSIQQVTAAREQIVATIRKAAESHKVDFNYMLQQASVESGLDPSARARTSSATGLYQFTAGTWLGMVKRHGEAVGLSEEARNLRAGTASAAEKARILALRNDPDTSAQLAARFALDNAKALAAAGHKTIGATELYLAHFLGSSGAAAFLDGLKSAPGKAAAAILPNAAQANLRIFYDGKAARSLQDVYDRFARKFAGIGAPAPAPSATPTADLAPVKQPVITDARLREIATQALALSTTQPPTPVAPTNEAPAPTANLSVDSLAAYLRKFELLDPQMDLARRGGPANRDASEGAHALTAETHDDPAPLFALGARLVLKTTQIQE